MIELAELKKELEEQLALAGYRLYDVRLDKGKEKILHVEIDEHLDLDRIAAVSEIVSAYLDEHEDYIDGEYLLDVATAGIERKLRSREDIIGAKNQYVFAKFKQPVGQLKEVYGTIEAVDDQNITLSYMDKNFKRKLTFRFDDIKFIRLAVKF